MLGLLTSKLKESFFSVIPIIILVLLLNYTIAPMPLWSVVLFLFSAFMMILGITFFNLGVDTSLIPIGEHVGSSLVKSRKLNFIVIYIVYCKNLLWFRGRHSYHILYVEWYYLEGSLEYGKKYYNI